VGCILYETGRHAVFVDPLAPPADAAFWAWADERCRGREVVLLETIRFHARSRHEFAERYSAAAAEPPPAVVALPVPITDETLYWLREHRALIVGDVLVGIDGRLSLCPPAWLSYLTSTPTPAAVAVALRNAIGDLDVEMVLVSHGEPTLGAGRTALERALRAA
jgi:glyoxylase-like metal-dependent hydrolase (beta-lactamase superfamily II)